MKISERIYNSSEVIAFRSTKEEFGGLSNMAPGYSIRVNDVIIPSAEALYQACRFPLFPHIQEEIINQNSPMTAKMISRKYTNLTRQDWEQIKYTVMYWVLKVKLSQNFDKFSNILKKTENKSIVELSNKDKDWAVVLMQLRSEFVFENDSIECVSPPNINGFMLYGSEVEIVCNPAMELENKLFFDLDYA
jgi:ribA/ribD-fused uncharacterized protein